MQYLVVFLLAAVTTTIIASPDPHNGGNQGSLMLDGTFVRQTTDGHHLPLDGASLPVVWRDFFAFNPDLSYPTPSKSDLLANNGHFLTTDGKLYAVETRQLVHDGVKQYFDRLVSESGEWPCFPDRCINLDWSKTMAAEYWSMGNLTPSYDMGLGGCKNCISDLILR